MLVPEGHPLLRANRDALSRAFSGDTHSAAIPVRAARTILIVMAVQQNGSPNARSDFRCIAVSHRIESISDFAKLFIRNFNWVGVILCKSRKFDRRIWVYRVGCVLNQPVADLFTRFRTTVSIVDLIQQPPTSREFRDSVTKKQGVAMSFLLARKKRFARRSSAETAHQKFARQDGLLRLSHRPRPHHSTGLTLK